MLATINAALAECTAARTRALKISTTQVRKLDDVASLQATAETWFHTHRPSLLSLLTESELAGVDESYSAILTATAKHASRSTYMAGLDRVKAGLIALRSKLVSQPARPESSDVAPDFAPLVGNPEMKLILVRRWDECVRCVTADAHLAAIVMMGGLLESLFVARANALGDKAPLVGAAAAPKDKAGKTINYQEWMLDSYIKVGRELGWLTESAKDVADVLKEFRNFIHPAKELRYGIALGKNDSALFWDVTKNLARQLLASA